MKSSGLNHIVCSENIPLWDDLSGFHHIRPNCFQISSQKPRDKQHVPWKNEPGIENQVKALSDQVKLISEKIGSRNPIEKKSILKIQVWIKKEGNLCWLLILP